MIATNLIHREIASSICLIHIATRISEAILTIEDLEVACHLAEETGHVMRPLTR
jgi:hypothetical protein